MATKINSKFSLTRASTVSTGDHLLRLFGLIIHVVLSKTEVTVRIWLGIFLPNEIRRRGEGHGDTSLTGRAGERRRSRCPPSGGGRLAAVVLRTVGLQRGSCLVATITSWRGNKKENITTVIYYNETRKRFLLALHGTTDYSSLSVCLIVQYCTSINLIVPNYISPFSIHSVNVLIVPHQI